MKHFIITRNLYKADFPNIAERVDIMRRVTIPSLRRQTNSNFTWILTGAEGLSPADFQGISYVVDPRFEKFIIGVTEAGEKIVTTRLDNDDCLLPNFVNEVQRIAQDHDEALIDCAGYRVDMRYAKVYEDTFYRSVPSPFLSVVETKRCKRCRIRTAYYDDHTLMLHHFAVVRSKTPSWVQIIHGLNKLMSRPEEDVRKRGKLLDVSYEGFLAEHHLQAISTVSDGARTSSAPSTSTAATDPTAAARSSAGPTVAGRTLEELAAEYGTDKLTHGYLTTYDRIMARRRHEAITIVEIGLKKRAKGVSGCESLRMWREYFPNARIVGLDIIDVSTLPIVPNTEVYQCDATQAHELRTTFQRYGIRPNILIDDGAHTPKSHQVALGEIFPMMPAGALYFIEDLQVCVNPEVFKRWEVTDENNTITYLQNLVRTRESYSVFLDNEKNAYLAEHIDSVTFENKFYMAVIKKK